MWFGATSRRFGTISIFPSIPIATYRIMLLLRKVVQVQMPGESTCRSRGAPLPADTLDRRPVTVSGDASASGRSRTTVDCDAKIGRSALMAGVDRSGSPARPPWSHQAPAARNIVCFQWRLPPTGGIWNVAILGEPLKLLPAQ